MEANDTHEKIVRLLGEKGPSLPINMSKELGMSSLFISAFLSELAGLKRVKISHLKVGGSPLYFLEGQEEKLEDSHKYMHPKEAETFLMLKKKKVLKDSEQEPAVRVALRSIRDFAVGFKIDDEIYWRYILVPEVEAEELLKGKTKKKGKSESKKEVVIVTNKDKIVSGFKNPVVISKRPKKKKAKSEFVMKVISFLNQNNLQIIEEKDYKVKEYNCIVRVRSELGQIDFLTQAKDKKTISESDLKKLLSNAQSIPIPAFMLYTKDISKKGNEFLKEYSSILKAKRII